MGIDSEGQCCNMVEEAVSEMKELSELKFKDLSMIILTCAQRRISFVKLYKFRARYF